MRNKSVLLILILWVLGMVLPVHGQPFRYGDWQTYLSHSRGIMSAQQGSFIYTITRGGMFSYNKETTETRVFSTIDGMSGITPTTLYYHEDADQIFIGYADGMIDYFSNPNEFLYLGDIARNTFFVDRKINLFRAEGNRLYVGTNFGLVIYDLDSGLPLTDVSQFGDNPSRTPIVSMALFEGMIYVVLEGRGIYSAPADFPNLKDPAIWVYEDADTGLPESENIAEIGAGGDRMFALTGNTIYRKKDGNWAVYGRLDRKWEHLYVTDDAVGASQLDRISVINSENIKYTFFITGASQNVVISDATNFFVTTTFRGLLEFDNWAQSNIVPPGPRSNDCTRLAVGNGEVYVAPKGYDQLFGPDNNAFGVYHYDIFDKQWTILDTVNDRLADDVGTSFARAYYDQETGNAYMGSWGSGLAVLNQAELQDAYNCTNSGISIINQFCNPNNTGNSRVSGTGLDSYGNLWVSLDFALPPLVVRTPEGDWHEVPNFRFPNGHHITEMMVDDYNNIWMVDNDKSLLVYTENGTPAVFDDGQMVKLRTGTNQGNLPSAEIFSLAKDKEGFIWVGTAKGVTVYFDPFSISQGRIVDASAPIFNGTFLLKNTAVTAIAVDGGNRKWLGTEDGLFLVSENGDELIHQFTTENSPLLSNRINDVQIDPESGLVFIATDRGLMSFQGDATEGETRCGDILVYPNPVFTDYDGLITIRGTAAESKVKITTVSGLLVREVDSQGGSATWDGRDVYGNQVRSGIYLALMADRNGENACIGKFTVIAR